MEVSQNDHIFPTVFFNILKKTLLVVQIDTIPHIKALNLSFMVLEVQEREIIMGTLRLLGRSSNRYGHLLSYL